MDNKFKQFKNFVTSVFPPYLNQKEHEKIILEKICQKAEKFIKKNIKDKKNKDIIKEILTINYFVKYPKPKLGNLSDTQTPYTINSMMYNTYNQIFFNVMEKFIKKYKHLCAVNFFNLEGLNTQEMSWLASDLWIKAKSQKYYCFEFNFMLYTTEEHRQTYKRQKEQHLEKKILFKNINTEKTIKKSIL